jgi:Prasinovirus endonuclease VII
MGQFIDLTNKRFGRLLVLGPQIHKRKLIHWLCRCDCSVEKWVGGQTLRIGTTKSCGCLSRELIGKRSLKDISGQRFGRFLVLNQHKIRGQSGIWLCRCDCGKEKWVRPTDLKTGVIKSCGCYGNEMRRKAILEKRKKYKVVLATEQRQDFETQIKEQTLSLEENLRKQILLLADQSLGAPSLTDKEIAKALDISADKAYYIRATFSDAEYQTRVNQKNRQRLLNPQARKLRLEVLKRYESKPETKILKRKYSQNLPPDVKARKIARAKIYSQTPKGKAKRKRELIRQKEWRRTPEGKAKTKKWVQNHKPRANQRYNERYRTDAQFRMSVSLRKRLNLALKAQNTSKAVRTFELIGCTLAELSVHLEKQFKSEMTWQKYGQWHIDHIVPCSKFDLTDLDQQRKCFHYSNLQPLWAIENIIKSNKIVSVPT